MLSISRRILVAIVAMTLLCASWAPLVVMGQSATPTTEPELALPPRVFPGTWPPPSQIAEPVPLPDSVCGDAVEIPYRNTAIETPEDGALVSPAIMPDADMYLLQISLPANSCVGFDGHALHNGAIVWYVMTGSIAMDIAPITGQPAPDVSLHRSNGAIEMYTESATLNPGDWITIDRLADYSYRSLNNAPAVLMMSVVEMRAPYYGATTFAAIPCRGICRGPRR